MPYTSLAASSACGAAGLAGTNSTPPSPTTADNTAAAKRRIEPSSLVGIRAFGLGGEQQRLAGAADGAGDQAAIGHGPAGDRDVGHGVAAGRAVGAPGDERCGLVAVGTGVPVHLVAHGLVVWLVVDEAEFCWWRQLASYVAVGSEVGDLLGA